MKNKEESPKKTDVGDVLAGLEVITSQLIKCAFKLGQTLSLVKVERSPTLR